MKWAFINCVVISCIVVSGLAYAEVYIVTDPKTDEVLSISSKDDCVGAEIDGAYKTIEELNKKVLNTSLDTIEISNKPSYYKYKNNKFVLNVKKMSDDALELESNQERKAEEVMVENRMKLNAMKELKAEGKQFKKIKEEDFQIGGE